MPRLLQRFAAALGLLVLLGGAPVLAHADTLRIGIIGTGNIGGALARLWVEAGHEVMMSSRNPERLQPLASELGERARVGTPREAAAFGEVILLAVPYGATPQVGRDYASELAGKVVLDAARQGVPLAGVVSFHGALATKTPATPGSVKAKILVEHGALDNPIRDGGQHQGPGFPTWLLLCDASLLEKYECLLR